MGKIETALPAFMYRDPSESVDDVRKLRKIEERKAKRAREHKHRRIAALVRDVLKNGGGRHGK